MTRIIIEGWRSSPNSYAVLNQFQCLEMLRRPEVELYHRDLPFWTPAWKPIPGLMRKEQEARIAAIPAPPPGLMADSLLRIAHPTRVDAASDAKRTFVWVVTEFGILEDSRIAGGLTAKDALAAPGVHFITCSKWSLDGLIRSGADPARVSLIPAGYDPALFRPIDEQQRARHRAALGWEGKFVFLNVSTLVWNKGLAGLLQAFAGIVEKYPQAALVIKGSNELLQSDRRLSETLASLPPALSAKVSGRMRYIGENLTHGQLAAMFASADAYVSPYHAEGFNMPVLEAAACGTPVIVTEGGSTDDFTDPSFAMRIRAQKLNHPMLEKNHGPGAMALMVDGDHLTQLLGLIIEDESFRRSARQAGPAYVRERFTWEKVVDQLLAVIAPKG